MAYSNDDNRSILNKRKSQYNVNAETPAQPVRESAPSSSATVSRTVNGASRKTAEDIITDAIVRRKRYVKRRNEKFARQNRETVKKAIAEGPQKVKYSYDEYTVSERNVPFGFLAIALALTLVAVFLLLNYSQISKYNTKINELNNDISSYEEETKQLSILLDKNCDFEDIEAYAKENGMIGSEQIESCYISMADSFKIENTADKEEEGYIFSTVMSGVIKLFSEVLGNE